MTFQSCCDIIHGMIRKIDSENKFFYVQCGDWDGTTVADSHANACKNILSQAIDKFGKEIKLTDVIISCDCDDEINNKEGSREGFLISRILKELSYEH